jgi:hypothetical protein
MPTYNITPARLLVAQQRFLCDHPEVVVLLQSITARHAGAVGMTLEQFQRSELERAIDREAKVKRISASELLLGYLSSL